MILIRFLLVALIVYLIVRSFVNYGEKGRSSGNQAGPADPEKPVGKKISKKIGEYVDYEELKK